MKVSVSNVTKNGRSQWMVSCPCRSIESAIKLAERFIAGVIKPRPASEPSTINSQPSTPQPVAA